LLSALALTAVVAACSSSSSADGAASGSCAVATGCGGNAANPTGFEVGGACTPCDGGVPSYQTDIVPILQTGCIPCHSPSGTAGFYEDTYPEVQGQFGSMLSQLSLCAMPPINGPQLSAEQRVTLSAWLTCGAPDN
jgi:hypothetical protein